MPEVLSEKEIAFEIDKQTLKDIDLFDHSTYGSIFLLLNNTRTIGGKDKLGIMLRDPLTDIGRLVARRDAIRFFSENEIAMGFTRQELDHMERYLSLHLSVLHRNIVDVLLLETKNRLNPTPDYYSITTGIKCTIGVLQKLYAVSSGFLHTGATPYILEQSRKVLDIITESGLSGIIQTSVDKKIPALQIAACDHYFRKDGSSQLRILLEWIYEMDAMGSVALAVKKHHLCFPDYRAVADSKVKVEGLFHPLLSVPVGNDLHIERNANLCFVTGANMSGKSTFLKSFGLAIYLAHLGFPVPARKMETTIFNGLMTTINLSDNINQGYSHFYSEVKRVRSVAQKIKEKKKIVVIFDELFRGTNVKDAGDASLLITSAFAGIKNSIFLISTHIVEIAEDLKKYDNIFFSCFASSLDGEIPIYNYKLKPGISQERVGMLIVKNEQIVEILKGVREEV
jgi:DNA mismatch repair ATPase MutS